MRLIFMGTPDFSLTILQALVQAGHDIAAVYCQPPRPAGRGKNLRASPVQKWAEAQGLPVRHPVNFKSETDVTDFADLQADVAVVVAYGLILPQEILDAPKRGCLNIHASLLPRWRGAAPIHRAIMAGDSETGICIMQMDAGLDTGAVLSRETTSILPTDTTAILHDRLAGIGAELITHTLGNLDDLKAIPQMADGMTYAKKINKSEARIDWSRPAQDIDRQIRGLSPFPGAWFLLGEERIKALFCSVTNEGGVAGTTLNDSFTVACGQGSIQISRLQKAGKSPQSSSDFLKGTKVPKGTKLE